jgi:hypothetical protein
LGEVGVSPGLLWSVQGVLELPEINSDQVGVEVVAAIGVEHEVGDRAVGGLAQCAT